MARDFQRARVYRWEEAVVMPRDPSRNRFEGVQALVTAVWTAEGLLHAPRVLPMPAHARITHATGSRTTIRVPDDVATWVVLHEIAHAMTSTPEKSDGHGPDYVGNYMRLLDRFLKIPTPLLMFTASEHKIIFNLHAKPYEF